MGRMEWSEGGKWDNCNSIINKYIKKDKTCLMGLLEGLNLCKALSVQCDYYFYYCGCLHMYQYLLIGRKKLRSGLY